MSHEGKGQTRTGGTLVRLEVASLAASDRAALPACRHHGAVAGSHSSLEWRVELGLGRRSELWRWPATGLEKAEWPKDDYGADATETRARERLMD
jgi:hypothetical protein